MVFKFLTNTELIIFSIILFSIILFIMFRWFFMQVRDICAKPGGFLIFGQITILLLSWACLISILLYYFYHQIQTDAVDIILTIVVGFLGTVIGAHFSQDSIKKVYESRLTERELKIKELLPYAKETYALLEELKKRK